MDEEITLFNTTKNQYLYIQDNQSDEDCDTEYTVYDLYGNDQDGGLLSAEGYGFKNDQEITAHILKELKWDQDKIIRLDPASAETFDELVRNWERLKIENATNLISFKNTQEEKWKKL